MDTEATHHIATPRQLQKFRPKSKKIDINKISKAKLEEKKRKIDDGEMEFKEHVKKL